MKILKAAHLGMCFGVRDAIALAQEHAQHQPLTVLGELVHNEAVLDDLRRQGIQFENDPARVETPVASRKLVKAAEPLLGLRPRGPKAKADPATVRLQKKLAAAAREVAEQLRPQDVDRILIDHVIRELRRIQTIAVRGVEHVPGASALPFEVGPDFEGYLASIHDAYQGSSELREEFVQLLSGMRLEVTAHVRLVPDPERKPGEPPRPRVEVTGVRTKGSRKKSE